MPCAREGAYRREGFRTTERCETGCIVCAVDRCNKEKRGYFPDEICNACERACPDSGALQQTARQYTRAGVPSDVFLLFNEFLLGSSVPIGQRDHDE